MKTLKDLLVGIEYSGAPDLQSRIDLVVMDSRKVKPGAIFVCVRGKSFDGHTVAQQAIQNGASAVVAEHTVGIEGEIIVANSRRAFALLCQNFFGHPQKKLCMIAVTGTNGKTTISSTVKQALVNLGYKTGLVGTIQNEIGDIVVPAKFTTPEQWDLSALLFRMVKAGCTHVVMEASSQALAQERLYGMDFDCAVFTNLTRDHLDYHETMEAYYQAKKMLFSQAKGAVINVDDESGRRLCSEITTPLITVSTGDRQSDYFAQNVEYSLSGVSFQVGGKGEKRTISFPMPGNYSVNNALCAFAALTSLGFSAKQSALAVESTAGVSGRCEVLYHGEYTVIGDFAHTADALEKLLSSLKPFVTQGRLVVLFGCAGERDRIKRPIMSKTVCDYADFIVVTADNPRRESAATAISDFEPELKKSGKPYCAIEDRYEAIRWAVASLLPGDVLALCGKGHEDYQVMDGYTIYLNERELVRELTSQ